MEIEYNDEFIEAYIKTNYYSKSSKVIGEFLGLKDSKVRHLARKYGIVKPKKILDINNKDFVFDNYYNMSVSEIAKYLSITETSVRRIASQLGITKRNILLESDYIKSDFKDIHNFDKYQINSLGVVIRKKDLVIIKSNTNIFNYCYVKLSDNNGNRRTQFIHRLLLSAFVGPEELQVNHKDSNTLNNDLSNLEYVTCEENLLHASENGLLSTKNISEEKVHLICDLFEKGHTIVEVIDLTENRISPYIIRNIKRKKSWVNISKNYNI